MSAGAQPFNVARKIGEVARAHPDLPAIIAADITLPYRNYWRIVQGFAVRMAERGVGQGTLVGVASRDLIASLAAQHATALLGAGHVVIEPEFMAAGTLTLTHAFCTPDSANEPGPPAEVIDASWPQAAPPDPEADGSAFPGYTDEEAAWYYVHTSGTTGRPKYMALSQRDVYLRSVAAAEADFPYAASRLCCLFPANTRPFFARSNAALFHAGAIIDTIDTAFLVHHGATLVCASPLTATDWLSTRRITPRLPTLQVSGSRLTDDVATKLLTHFECVEDVYGASETSKSYVTQHRMSDGRLTHKGKPLDSEVELVGEDGAPVEEPGKAGRLRVRNPYMAKAYLEDPAASAEAFRDGWFYPGDLATWGPNRDLLIEGRGDHLLNLGGLKMNPEDIEAHILAVPGIKAAAAMRLPGEGVPLTAMALVEMEPGADPATAIPHAQAACQSAGLPDAAIPRLILVVPELPLTEDHMPKRKECLALAREAVAGLNVKELMGHG